MIQRVLKTELTENIPRLHVIEHYKDRVIFFNYPLILIIQDTRIVVFPMSDTRGIPAIASIAITWFCG